MLGRLGTIFMLRRSLRLGWRLLRDSRVPATTKLVVPLAVLYALFPVDFLPDFLPALGQVDDLTALLTSLMVFIRIAPKEVVQEHLEAMAGRPKPKVREEPGKVIEGDYKVLK